MRMYDNKQNILITCLANHMCLEFRNIHIYISKKFECVDSYCTLESRGVTKWNFLLFGKMYNQVNINNWFHVI